MSLELFTIIDGRQVGLGQFASNHGYRALDHYLEHTQAHIRGIELLDQFLHSGLTQKPITCKRALADIAASAPTDVADTAAVLIQLLSRCKGVAIISDGMAVPVMPQITKQLSSTLTKALRNPGHTRDVLQEFSSSLKQQLRASLLDLGPAPSQKSLYQAIDNLDWSPLYKQLQPYLRDMSIRGGLFALDQSHENTADHRAVLLEDAARVARKRSSEIIGMKLVRGKLQPDSDAVYAISQTANRELKEIAQALAGDSTDEITDALLGARSFSPERLNMIADTEIERAKHSGKRTAFQLAGVRQVKWILDPRYKEAHTKCECPALAAASPYPADEVPDRPHVGCMCDIAPA